MEYYSPPSSSHWTCRQDDLTERLAGRVECISIEALPSLKANKPAYALIGYACDEGIKRNLGRVGAAKGPLALRQVLGPLPCLRETAIYDLGDVICIDRHLEAAQQALAEITARTFSAQLQPIIMGGGHDVAWGHFQGLMQANKHQDIGIINFDAHFDLRPLLANEQGSSGTSFLQIAQAQQQHQCNFHYLCLGVQPQGNTRSLFKQAEQLHSQYILAEELITNQNKALNSLEKFMQTVSSVYLTLCLDVFNLSFAPGVSAPQALGLAPWHVLPLFNKIVASGKVISFDVAELSPPLDNNNQTAKLAAAFIGQYINAM